MSAAARPAAWGTLWAFAGAYRRFLTAPQKRRFAMVSALACGLALVEMLVAGAVIPYVQCLGGVCPRRLDGMIAAIGLSRISGLSAALFALICLRAAAQTSFSWFATRFHQQVQRETVRRLLDGYLHLDWRRFREESTTHYFRRCATTAVDAAWTTNQGTTLVAAVPMLLLLGGLMLAVYPIVSTLLMLGFVGLVAGTHALLGPVQSSAGARREAMLKRWNVDMAEAFSAFREVRVYGLERYVVDEIDSALGELAAANVRLSFVPALPRVFLDFVVLAALLGFVIAWTSLDRPLAALLPQLVFYAVVARAMLPAMMNVTSIASVLAGSICNIDLLQDELARAAVARRSRIAVPVHTSEQAGFALDRVSFRHAPDQRPILADADLFLPRAQWAALIGPSGAGKSTVMELLCGILPPQSGTVEHRWPEHGRSPHVAYIPQQVALLDDSLFRNVVFGFDAGDVRRVREALRLACLGPLAERLPQELDASVGADGASLSGGERQRLAIARALYRSPDLLLLDEATSGLDEVTETRLLSGLRQARPDITVLFITHRPNNLRFADRVFQIEDGQVLCR